MNPIKIRIKEDNFLESSAKIDNAIQKVWFPAIVTVKRDMAGISEVQRGYYFWVVVRIVMDYHGIESKEEAHKMLKYRFLLDYEDLLQNMIEAKWDDEKTFHIARYMSLCDDLTITTSEKWEFEQYLKDIRTYYSHQWVFIPLPNEEEQWEWWQKMK